MQNFVDVGQDALKFLLVWDILSKTDVVLVPQDKLVLVLVHIEKSLQVSKSIVRLFFRDLGANSSLALSNIAPVVEEELSCDISAVWLNALVDTSIIHHLKLFEEKFDSVSEVSLWNLL